MKRNIDILKEIEKEIKAFKYTEDEISQIIDIEECDIEDLYNESDCTITSMKLQIFKIADLLEQLTEDFRDMFDYEEFDCDSVRWCVGKVKYNDYEIVNYYNTFVEMISTLDFIVGEYMRAYKIVTQSAYTADAK